MIFNLLILLADMKSDKVNVSCLTAMHEYDQYMGRVDLSDQMKVSYQLDRKASFIFI